MKKYRSYLYLLTFSTLVISLFAISQRWRVEADNTPTSGTFTNASPITINDQAVASPYPSQITVSGLSGNIDATPAGVSVTLNGFTHTFPDDVGIVLVSPSGTAFLMQDGATDNVNGNPASNVTYTVSDSGATRLPDTTELVNGTTYQPAAYYTGDAFPDPGPGTTYNAPGPAGTATFASSFGGTNPNGVWNLYVVDFTSPDSGTIQGGWTLTINTDGGVPTQQLILDPSFEQGNPWPAWTIQTSTNFGTPLCDGTCGAGAFHGTNWAAFASVSGALEDASLGQTVTIPAGVSAMLSYELSVPSIEAPATSTLKVLIDGNVVQTISEPNAISDYTLQTIDISSKADGNPHTIRFDFSDTSTPSDFGDSYFVDDVKLFVVAGGPTPTPTPSPTPSATPTPTPTPIPRLHPANVDMDGDGFSDFVQVRQVATSGLTDGFSGLRVANRIPYRRGPEALQGPVTSDATAVVGQDLWYVRYNQSLNGPFGIVQWGQPETDWLTPADFDGDGKVDTAIWRPSDTPGQSMFFVINSSSGTVSHIPLGEAADYPTVVADYDGDHIADPAVFSCPATAGPCSYQYIGSHNNPGGSVTTVPWGNGDQDSVFPVVGDFDGDGKADFCVYIEMLPNFPGAGGYSLHKSDGTPDEFIEWGLFGSDIILPADFDGDGKTDLVAVRDIGGNYVFYVLTRTGQFFTFQWGITGDIPTPGDYDGDGKDDIAIYRPGADLFFVVKSSDGQFQIVEWGSCTSGLVCDEPAAAWQVLR